ncbi:MAG: molybdopterin cofactor-binding domain-containing protein, partial [Ruthenibacterium sp.]
MADYTADGTLTLWTSTQSAISHRMILARYFELPMNRVRLIAPAMGGGFGGKVDAGFQPVVACLAMRTGRPVKLRFTRRETMISTSTRTAARIRVKTGIDREGHILAQDIDVLTNSGAYATCGPVVIGAMSGKVFKVLKTPNLRYHGMAVYTNTPNGGAMRGYGSPQAFTALGTQYNRIANDLKMDLTDFFAANLIEPDGVEQIHQTVIGNSRPLDCLSRGKALFGWEEKPLREERGRYLYGKGMNVGCHGNGVFGSFRDM